MPELHLRKKMPTAQMETRGYKDRPLVLVTIRKRLASAFVRGDVAVQVIDYDQIASGKWPAELVGMSDDMRAAFPTEALRLDKALEAVKLEAQ